MYTMLEESLKEMDGITARVLQLSINTQHMIDDSNLFIKRYIKMTLESKRQLLDIVSDTSKPLPERIVSLKKLALLSKDSDNIRSYLLQIDDLQAVIDKANGIR